ncbi:MAG TPA: ABC transporter substrate-binding protein [Burkholderiales bacterium]|nr:ABC transporter substrate-binding protein [Burkholderiales bacterium]
MKRRLAAVVALAGLAACGVVNAPVSREELERNILFSSYQETPKHLDSAASYSNNETPWTYAIYEPPLRYHYLKRPYELIPRTLVEMPATTYLDKDGKTLPADARGADIAESVVELRIRPGILYEPHPAFARDEQGKLLYHALTPKDLEGKARPADFPKAGTRELLAEDYAYAIKRIATPRIQSPSFGFLSGYIVGMEEYGKQIKKVNDAMKAGRTAREAGVFGDLPWLDFRKHDLPGVQVVDSHTLRIRIKGKYPQFKYWLAMTFFAPTAWEVDAFYSQPGMKGRNLTLDTWPVGTGPFRLTEYVPNHRMELQRNPNYRGEAYPCEGEPEDKAKGFLADCGKKTPFLDGMVSIIDKEASPMTTKFIQGYYDVPQFERGEPGTAYLVAIQDNTGRAKELLDHKIQLPNTLQVGLWYYGFNWLDPVVGAGANPQEAERNRKLRQALAIAFDFEEYIQIFEDNRAVPNMGPVVGGLFGADAVKYNPVAYDMVGGKPKRRSIEAAKKLLAEAGYPDGRDAKTGKPLVINYDAQGVGPGYKSRVDWTVKQFAKLNIQLEVRDTDYNRFQDKMRKGTAQLFFWGWLADYPDPENFLFLLYGPNSKVKTDGENVANYANPEFDKLFERMKDLDDTDERKALIRQMVEIVQKDAVWLWGWTDEYSGAYNQWVFNGKPSNIIRDQLQYLRIDPQLRMQMVDRWNTPNPWPLVALALLLLAVAWPAWLAWKRRQNATATGVPAPAPGAD